MSMENLEKEMKLLKAKAAKAELKYKIEKLKKDIERIENHIKLQDEIIKELE